MKKTFYLIASMCAICSICTAQQAASSAWNSKSQEVSSVRKTFNQRRLTTGVSLIGSGVAVYFISNGIMNIMADEIKNGTASGTPEEQAKRLNNINKARKITYWVGGAAALTGTIFTILSLETKHVNSEGVVIGKNMYLRDQGMGAAFSCKF